ncbi:MAG: sulfatase-like hydrolase/transferase [Spirochaeta sp.]|jgi:arylsulfatase A-like enzyme|nr:sulfatase-like hydrolase/transferase [Spirochaeta sp.]
MKQRSYIDNLTGRAPFVRSSDATAGNVVFISTDMVPPEFWRNPTYVDIRQTPALDQLAADGTHFTNTFATAPVCSPSRAAYLTGRHSYIMTNGERGHDGHEMHLRPSDTIFPEYLAATGYYTRHVGKSHVGRHKFMDAFGENDSPWDRWSPPWFDDDRYLSYLQRLGLGPISFDREIYGMSAAGVGRGNFYGGWIARQNGREFPIEGTYPWYLVEYAIETLTTRPSSDKPIYLQLDFFAPHQPFAIPGGMSERERAIRKSLPDPIDFVQPMEDGSFASRDEPRVYELYRRNWGIADRQTVEDYMVANLLQYEVIDRALGRLFDFLRQENLYDDTTVVFTADHGEMNCNLGLIDKGSFLNPHVMRVPLVVKPSRAIATSFPVKRCETPVSLLDIAPTMYSLAGITPLDRIDGVSLQETIRTGTRVADRPIMAEVWSHVVPNPCVGTVFDAADGEQYFFSFNICDQTSELYRLGGDRELENLFNDPACGPQRQEAIETLHARLGEDERWKGYHAYSALVFARVLDESGDQQHFM